MLALAILLIVGLAILFIVTFVIYKKIPAPKGNEKIRITDENCSNCNQACSFNRKDDKK